LTGRNQERELERQTVSLEVIEKAGESKAGETDHMPDHKRSDI
jgi:hypothetical protein